VTRFAFGYLKTFYWSFLITILVFGISDLTVYAVSLI